MREFNIIVSSKLIGNTASSYLGSCSMAHADKAMQSLILIGRYGYIYMKSQPVIKQILNLIGQWNWIAHTAMQRCCIPAVSLSCDWAELQSHWAWTFLFRTTRGILHRCAKLELTVVFEHADFSENIACSHRYLLWSGAQMTDVPPIYIYTYYIDELFISGSDTQAHPN